MSDNFKKIFFSSLLTVLFIISNLIGLKYTNFMGLVVSVNFITYPFIMLCILLLLNIFGRKDTYNAITTTIFIQVFILLSYTLAVNLGSQAVIPDMANAVNQVFLINEYGMMASLIGFMISNYILIYIYEYFRAIGYKLLGTFLSILVSLIAYGLIYISISNYSLEIATLLNLLLCHIIMSCVMAVVVIILFYLLKNKENIYEEKKVFISDVDVSVTDKKLRDKPIMEVIKVNKNKDGIAKKSQKERVNKRKRNQKNDNKSKKVDK